MRIQSLLLLLFFLLTGNVFGTECFYVSKSTSSAPCSEIESQGNCGLLGDEDTFILNKAHLDRIFFSKDGLASVIVQDETEIKVFYVAEDGKTVRTYLSDNGADTFVEDLARTITSNKFGFINRNLQTVISPEYDFVFPFHNGHAVVCRQCSFKQVEEHQEVTGGSWGVINKKGERLIPVKYSHENLVKTKVYKEIFLNH